ncbi:ABC transporter permease [Saccharopolyspora hordei]|uniref:Peptide/nickel transport system permease protein n=1 Tax=Saccharopolyspora hordei TaxID=1838 RepID=A0A853AV94_9PSEU|nr:ABC transporter permease [Saccharopolyspora hordei]NYI86558.1 peptide/nickel transport system permease protein [Saccharopolyspora hordei]
MTTTAQSTGTATAASPPAPRPLGVWRAALRLPRTKVGLALSGLVVAIAVVGPLLAPHTATEFVDTPFSDPTANTWFGTDNLGRDVLTRFLHGGRTLLLLAALATLLGVGLGALLGMYAGYRRGWLDEVLMRFGDVALAFPQVVLALLFVSVVGPQLWLLVLVVGGSHLPRVMRVVRAATLSVAERDFVASAEAIGLSKLRILLGEILPNVTGTVLVEFGLRLNYSIGLVAGLSFLGLGLQPPTADWGLMINENRIALTVQPWAVALPVVAIAVLTIGTNLVADGLARSVAGVDRGIEKAR